MVFGIHQDDRQEAKMPLVLTKKLRIFLTRDWRSTPSEAYYCGRHSPLTREPYFAYPSQSLNSERGKEGGRECRREKGGERREKGE